MRTFGSWVALVTPFDKDGAVDFGALKDLIDFQIENGTDNLFFMGSTGEVNMLTAEERRQVVKEAVKYTKGRIPAYFGATFSTTAETVSFARYAEAEGADGLVFAAPAYSMPSQAALKEFSITAIQSVSIPAGLYVNPARTSVMLEPETLLAISQECGNLVVVKEGLSSIQHLNEVQRLMGDRVSVVGVDALSCSNLFASLAVGGRGLNNAIGNVIPQETVIMSRPWESMENIQACRETWQRMFPLIKALNGAIAPVCFKAAMNILGLPGGYLRKPLLELDDASKANLKRIMDELGILEKYGRK